jgi:putative ABC transport system permease protein
MTLLIGALTVGLILSLLALGIFISFRIFEFADITADGSITLGAAVAAVLLIHGVSPIVATAAAFLSGAVAGSLTGIIHTRFGINRLLSGILVMTALYSINLHVMGRSNVPLLEVRSLATQAEHAGAWLSGSTADLHLWGWDVAMRDGAMLVLALATAVVVGALIYIFFRTNLGTAMQAAGDNPQMIRALGVNVENMVVLGLAVSNGLVALSGALLAQYQGFADVQMGIGMIVWGLASIIIGEALVGVRQLGLIITGAVMGSVLFRLLVAIALRGGLNPNDLKLVTALFVFLALVLPGLLTRFGAASRKRPVEA